jgi:hypothetical protein
MLVQQSLFLERRSGPVAGKWNQAFTTGNDEGGFLNV